MTLNVAHKICTQYSSKPSRKIPSQINQTTGSKKLKNYKS